MSVPIFTSPGRAGFGPQLALTYDSGVGNGPFGLGWHLNIPAITRKTDKGLPQYLDADDSDVFILAGAEDLVPTLVAKSQGWVPEVLPDRIVGDETYAIRRYRPRTEGLFARIERWSRRRDGDVHWRAISPHNVTTMYGVDEDSRIANPDNSSQIFSWLIAETYDDKGNATLYEYEKENHDRVDRSDVSEAHRLTPGTTAQRYLKRIKYSNATPRLAGENLRNRTDWLFEVVFDYGEHVGTAPTTRGTDLWRLRADPFSSYRSTFEVRTYRLCRRVLMFHHFNGELEVEDCLVRSTDFSYREEAAASVIQSVTQTGYTWQRDTKAYVSQAFPAVTFKYSRAKIDETVRDADRDSIENLPDGVDGSVFRWVDLDREGIAGALTAQGDGWFYKRNLGGGKFGPLETIARRPAAANLGAGQQLLDLAGEGRLDLVQWDGAAAGVYTQSDEGEWGRFQAFQPRPTIDVLDPHVRFVDLTGDGLADILIAGDGVFTWHESLAREGFAPARTAWQGWDETDGPRLVFSNPEEAIFLADCSGDGLSDLVRIRNGEVCYWPSLGYGRFGAKVTMGTPPIFDTPEAFDPRRLRLADLDGSGTTDIVYLHALEVRVYLNDSGNGWRSRDPLLHFPRIDNLSSVTVTDLFGNGTACLVWSSPLAAGQAPVRFIDLMGGVKPHLLIEVDNHLGAKTTIDYAASTQFYLEDRRAGRPWVTKLPFPVHVVSRVVTEDLVSQTRLEATYRYRHGYFDGVEREFRGFAFVERRDAETLTGEFDLALW